MATRDKIYFLSDIHLGVGSAEARRAREARVTRWLDSIKHDAAEIFFVGDVFDFWFEYAAVVPKGHLRFLGKLAELADAGVKLYFFKGNHDMWMFDYFEEELGAVIISDEMTFERGGKKFYLHHGDGLGPGDKKYKLLKKFFRSAFCQWLFARIHPNLGVGIANKWSRKSRKEGLADHAKIAVQQSWLVIFCNELLKTQYYDYLIFGHRHKPLDIVLDNGKSRYINLGEWVFFNYSYAVFDGADIQLFFEKFGDSPY